MRYEGRRRGVGLVSTLGVGRGRRYIVDRVTGTHSRGLGSGSRSPGTHKFSKG